MPRPKPTYPPPDPRKLHRCLAWQPHGKDDYCYCPAVPGSRPPRCGYHGGRRKQPDNPESADYYVRTSHMGTPYHGRLKSTIAQKVEEYLGRPREEQLALFEELAVCRAELERKVLQWDEAVLQVEQAQAAGLEDKKVRILVQLADIAALEMRSALVEVRDMCSRAAQVEQSTKGLVTPMMLALFVNQLVRLFYKELDHDTAMMLERKMRQFKLEVVTPDQGAGTALTPDATVLLMDQTVPVKTEEGR